MRVSLLKTACIVFALCITSTIGSFAQSSTAPTFKTLVNLDGTGGPYPNQQVIQGFDGNLYGVFFKVTPAGTLTSWTVDSTYRTPFLSTLGTDGNFYGTTFAGGTEYQGSVFQMTPDGQLATLYSFCDTDPLCPDDMPFNGVIQGSDGNFLGTTSWPRSTIFKITPTGSLTTLYTFLNPPYSLLNGDGPLTEGADGNFYGIDGAAVFSFSPAGEFKVLHTFCMLANCADGGIQQATQLTQQGPLIQTGDGIFYGETQFGGVADSSNCLYRQCGTIFRMTPDGGFRTIHSFCIQKSCPDGDQPIGGLTLGSDGMFYGVTQWGGAHNLGTIFKITPDGLLTTLHSFDSIQGWPSSGLVQATNGTLYGGMGGGRRTCCGSIYSLSVGLPRFVKTVPTMGDVGGAVIILGNDLTGASSVTFNGIPAAFTVVSDTEIIAAVPTGATTGTVEVSRPHRTLRSNVPFQIGLRPVSGPGWITSQD